MSMFDCIKIDSKDFVDLVKLVRSDVIWLVNNNKMYLSSTEDTMWNLKQEKKELECMMEGVAFNMEKALGAGWWQLNPDAKVWLSYGIEAIERAKKIQSKYDKDNSTDGNSITSILLCPCETLSFRMLNARAITRRHNINRHAVKGLVYKGDIEYKVFALKKGDNDPRVMDPDAISSFCVAQQDLEITERIKALLNLPRSVLQWRNQIPLPSSSDDIKQELCMPLKSCDSWHAKEASDVEAIHLDCLKSLKVEESVVKEILQECCNCNSSQAEEARDHVQPIESECSESFQVEEASQASDDKEMQLKWLEILKAQEEAQAREIEEMQKLKLLEDVQAKLPSDAQNREVGRCKSLRAEEARDVEKIQLSHFVKYSAFPRSQCYDGVPVLIRAKAPSYTRQPRAPIDLVMVLGICGSVDEENKLEQLKQGCKFVVHNLEAKDRLSIVMASSDDNDDGKPSFCFQLTYMTDNAKRSTNQFIASLQPRGGVDMVTEAMQLAYKALGVPGGDDRVGSVMLLSDAKLITTGGGEDSAPAENYCITNTLGLGRSHDPCSLYASVTRGHGHGTYSFVADSYENVREAMAMYIGGLTSITARDAEICIRSAHPAVRISSIAFGGYDCTVEEDGKLRKISLNDLYASEEKSFIVYVDIPAEESGGSIFSGTPKTKLLFVTASYCCPVSRARVGTDVPMEISVERPRWGRTQDGNISIEVATEVLRTKVFNGVNEIWSQGINPTTTAAKVVTGKLARLRKDIQGTNEAKAAMDVWLDLCEDLDHMQEGGSSDDDKLYMETVGLSYMLSWLSSHRSQRAATPGSASKSRSLNLRTTRMQNMIDSVDTAPSAYIE